MTTSDRPTTRPRDDGAGEPSPAVRGGVSAGPAPGGPGPGGPGSHPPAGASSMADPNESVSWSERLALRNWNLPVKLAAVLLVPTVFVISLGVLRIVEQTEKASSYDGVEQAVALEDRTSTLLSDLAAERTAAGVFVASGRAGGPAALQRRIDASTRDAADLRQAQQSSGSLDDQTNSAYRQASTQLSQLERLRGDALSGRIDASGVVSRYGEVTAGLLKFDQSLTRQAADPSVAGLSTGLYSLSLVREQDSFIEAVVSTGLAAGRIDAPSIDQARNASLRRSIAVDDFRTAVGTDDAALAASVVGADVNQRDLLAQVVLGRGSAGLPLQVSPVEWSRTSQAVEEQDGKASAQVRDQLQGNAAALQNAARNSAGVASVVLLLALLAGAAMVYFVTRSLLRPLRLLRRSALDVAERRLPGAVRSLREGETPDTAVERTPIETKEEIGQVARAFDQVHEQAVRLAAEQAGLRAAFNAIFINLSRRSQALVERQLRLIEQLENNEEDPEALSNLFQLDHLATRMRRNSENLLVLSGTDLSRRGTRPVPLVDVLRAGTSEVEQYQRVDLSPPPSVLLLGGTASDVVHLVAELLENATTFSAPDTRVEVRATQGSDGGVLVEIRDEGVGMNEQDLRDANTRLHSPPTVDVSASRRMGLFVVGRLATRHGIAVSLRSREPSGVVASAVIPPSSVLASAAGGGPREVAAGQPGPTGTNGSMPGRGAPTNGAAPFSPAIPNQDGSGRSGDIDPLPRRDAGTARPGPSAPAAFFSPTVQPDADDRSAPSGTNGTNVTSGTNGSSNGHGAPGTNGAAATNGVPATNGTHGTRRPGPPTRDDTGEIGPSVNGVRPGRAPEPDDADDDDASDDDTRTAGTPSDDQDDVTVWRRVDGPSDDDQARPDERRRPPQGPDGRGPGGGPAGHRAGPTGGDHGPPGAAASSDRTARRTRSRPRR